MGVGGQTTSSDGHVRYEAGGEIDLRLIAAGTGSVALLSGAAINDADSGSAINVSGAGLLMVAGGAIGAGTDALEVSVDRLAASAGAGGCLSPRALG